MLVVWGQIIVIVFPFFCFLMTADNQIWDLFMYLCIAIQLHICNKNVTLIYVYHGGLTILDTNNVFHSRTILKIDGINTRFLFFFLYSEIESMLLSPEQTLKVWNESVPAVEASGGRRTCLFLQMEQSYASVSVSSFSSHRLLDLPPVTTVTPVCPRKPLADAEHRLN